MQEKTSHNITGLGGGVTTQCVMGGLFHTMHFIPCSVSYHAVYHTMQYIMGDPFHNMQCVMGGLFHTMHCSNWLLALYTG